MLSEEREGREKGIFSMSTGTGAINAMMGGGRGGGGGI